MLSAFAEAEALCGRVAEHKKCGAMGDGGSKGSDDQIAQIVEASSERSPSDAEIAEIVEAASSEPSLAKWALRSLLARWEAEACVFIHTRHILTPYATLPILLICHVSLRSFF